MKKGAVSYLIGIYVQVWEELAEIPDAKRYFNAAEHLVHTTKKNHADLRKLHSEMELLKVA